MHQSWSLMLVYRMDLVKMDIIRRSIRELFSNLTLNHGLLPTNTNQQTDWLKTKCLLCIHNIIKNIGVRLSNVISRIWHILLNVYTHVSYK